MKHLIASSPRPLKRLALAGFICLGSLATAQMAMAADLTVRLAWYMPPNTAVSAQGEEIAQQIEKLSDGDIAVQTFPSGSLLKESNIGQGIANNTTNMGILGMHWWSNQAPSLAWDTIPFLVDDASDLLTALHGPLGKDVDKTLNKFGVKVVGWGFYGYAESYLNTKKPIKTPSDLKGLKMRSEGKLSAEFLKSQGATPVAVDSSEVYTAMQRGTLDGGVSGMSSIVSRKWYEVGDYITAIHYVPLVYPIQVNRNWWENELTDAQRATIEKAVASTESDAVKEIEDEFKRQIAMAEKHGNKVYRPSDDDLQKWREATTEQAKKSYLEDAGDAGQKILADFQQSASTDK
ncbi:TRAP transporter substrate-binding protein DctP [Salinisphaera sp. T31B1]|uniref:TRAP transporter substrate-binding protein n=1 Tax=Salinisphaera sp. T31B1 TaxID=727963 RepID=UPI0033409E3E